MARDLHCRYVRRLNVRGRTFLWRPGYLPACREGGDATLGRSRPRFRVDETVGRCPAAPSRGDRELHVVEAAGRVGIGRGNERDACLNREAGVCSVEVE